MEEWRKQQQEIIRMKNERFSKISRVPNTSSSKEKVTFKVHDVEQSQKRLEEGVVGEIVLERCGSVTPEAFSDFKYVPFEHTGSYEPICNGFIAAVHTAFSQHYPLVFSPDAIWLCIMQGLSFHINTNADKMRSYFVEHEGKKDITVCTEKAFVKGSPSNPWPEIFDKFSHELRRHVGEKTHDILTPSFTTTGPVERAASQIVLMDCFKQYFCYKMVCICGIPEITLEGTVDDWKLLREKALALREYDLDWWINELEPVLDQFVAAASGNVDKDFWVSIYKLDRAYGVELINGWILTLFPYLEGRGSQMKRNEYMSTWQKVSYEAKPTESKGDYGFSGGPDSTSVTTSSFHPGVVSVPFEWIVLSQGKQYPMQFYAGFMAATQDPDTMAIHPELGWAVADRNEIETSSKKLSENKDFW